MVLKTSFIKFNVPCSAFLTCYQNFQRCFRYTGNDNGVFSAIHPSYDQLLASYFNNSSSVDLMFLRDIIANLRWDMKPRNFRSFNIMTTQVTKEQGVTSEIEIRIESTMARLNLSNSITRDYQPTEIFYQWKDGYMIVSDKFLAVSIFDIFGIIASILLMLERAYLTWKRVLASWVHAKSKIYLDRYVEGSRESVLVQSILDGCTNLVSVVVALSKINSIAAKLDRFSHAHSQFFQGHFPICGKRKILRGSCEFQNISEV